MPQLSKTFEIEGYEKKFTVKELRISDILSLIDKDSLDEIKDVQAFIGKLDTELLPLCSNVSIKELVEMYPSEVEIVLERFMEVNAPFLRAVRAAGLDKMINDLKIALLEDFGNFAALSSKRAMLES